MIRREQDELHHRGIGMTSQRTRERLIQRLYEEGLSNAHVLETNRRALDIEAQKRAVSWLSDARQILALGMGGGSTICAQEIQYRLFRLGLPVVSQNDGLLVRMMPTSSLPMLSGSGRRYLP